MTDEQRIDAGSASVDAEAALVELVDYVAFRDS